MRAALRDLRVLWATRKGSGFPWPSPTVMGRFSIRRLLLGYPPWCVIPLWKQVLTIPLRPWRYAKMVRSIARTRNFPYTPSRNDDVP